MTGSDTLFSQPAFLAGIGKILPRTLRQVSDRPPAGGHTVCPDFIGVCVAPSDEPAGDDYLVARLREAGLENVRLDITYGFDSGPAGRLLTRLISDGFKIWLHPVQPFDEARAMPAPEAVERWTQFLRKLFTQYKTSVRVFEVGSTCNRRKWTGYRRLDHFLAAWKIAHVEARTAGVTLAGVNVTDFEPVYNAGFLEILSRRGLLPDIHSDNLFAERATEPENFDPKILGPNLAGWSRFNLMRKARLLDAIGRAYGLTDTVCTHTAWSERRIRRLLEDADQKQADYLARYLLIAAASGALTRVYWGPLIGQREGLIDDGTQEYPEPIPHVTFYGRAPGDPARYCIRPAFHALRTLVSFLPGAVWSRSLSSCREIEILEFRTSRGWVHAGWTVNGRVADLSALYSPEALASAQFLDRDGRTPIATPAVLTESPLYLFWENLDRQPEAPRPAAPMPGLTVDLSAGRHFQPIAGPAWVGMVVLPETQWPEDPATLDLLFPGSLEKSGRDVLRQARNIVWAVPHPFDPGHSLVVKRACATAFHKRLLAFFQPSKARRSWNSACEMKRRGVTTPDPVAFFEMPVRHAARVPSYYVCRRFEGTGSVRTAFTAFSKGESTFEGIPKDRFYRELAAFTDKMHERGVFHRDLSAGNVMAAVRDGQVRFSVIDTGRARFYPKPLSLSLRLADLKRICHPLSWTEREVFVSLYLGKHGVPFTGLRRLPFALYDLKHAVKKILRPFRGK